MSPCQGSPLWWWILCVNLHRHAGRHTADVIQMTDVENVRTLQETYSGWYAPQTDMQPHILSALRDCVIAHDQCVLYTDGPEA